MAAVGRTINFSNGRSIPILGLGTWKSKPGEVTAAVKDAITAGYRHIDCAHVYCNEPEVGVAIAAVIKDGTVTRDELFITSKVWNTFHAKLSVLPALKTTRANLGSIPCPYFYTAQGLQGHVLPRVYLPFLTSPVHWPMPFLRRVHPPIAPNKLIEFCKSKDITVTAYSPLGSPDRPWAKPGDPVLTEEPKVKTLAQKYKKSPAQILIRFQIDRGLIVIPKSVTKSRIEENFQIWDFQLSSEDIKLLESLECNGRVCAVAETSDHPYYPFHDEY
nr:aldo-keto reductase family 1 member B1-like [Cherax quadricarinatus]